MSEGYIAHRATGPGISPMRILCLSCLLIFISLPGILCIQTVGVEDALKRGAGVYKNRQKSIDAQLTRTAIISVVNFGWMSHFHNFDCYMKRLDFSYVAFTLDHTAAVALDEMDDVVHVFWSAVASSAKSEDHFRSEEYNVIVKRKFQVTLKTLELGYDVVLLVSSYGRQNPLQLRPCHAMPCHAPQPCTLPMHTPTTHNTISHAPQDLDVMLFKDPMPYLRWKNVDYVHSENVQCVPACYRNSPF